MSSDFFSCTSFLPFKVVIVDESTEVGNDDEEECEESSSVNKGPMQ